MPVRTGEISQATGARPRFTGWLIRGNGLFPEQQKEHFQTEALPILPVGMHFCTRGKQMTWKKPNTGAKVNRGTEWAWPLRMERPDGNVRMSRLASGLVAKMLTSWKMYGLLCLIIHAPGNVAPWAAECNSKIHLRPFFSQVNEQTLQITMHELVTSSVLSGHFPD